LQILITKKILDPTVDFPGLPQESHSIGELALRLPQIPVPSCARACSERLFISFFAISSIALPNSFCARSKFPY
jgi:hypothetical protein